MPDPQPNDDRMSDDAVTTPLAFRLFDKDGNEIIVPPAEKPVSDDEEGEGEAE